MTVKQSFYLIRKSDSVLYLRQVISSEEYCPILSHEQFCTLSINRESFLTNTIRAIADKLTKLVVSKSPGFVQVLCYLCVTNDSLESLHWLTFSMVYFFLKKKGLWLPILSNKTTWSTGVQGWPKKPEGFTTQY